MPGAPDSLSRPGKPVDNAFAEAFNGTVRRECLSQHWFKSLEDAQQTLDAWRKDYNNVRPHGSLAYKPPAEYRRGGHFVPDRERIENSLSGPSFGGGPGQLPLFEPPEGSVRRSRLNRALDEIADRFGTSAVVRGSQEHAERAGLSMQIKRGEADDD